MKFYVNIMKNIYLKDCFGPEPYVTLNLSRGQRSVCAQLRCGTLPLASETGRFHSVPEEERTCAPCDLKDIENEMHFLFYCPLYHDLCCQLCLMCLTVGLLCLMRRD
ncbi:hypothetical protein NL108_008777 [Boleophthalmus pectinirostris]|nr:hypothetical protein NL108_008777 [Boleophthalmus pectinirostris]